MRRLLLVLSLLLLPTAVWAQTPSRLDEIVARGILKVGLTGDYRPFSVLDKATDKYSGLDVDMATNLAETLGVKLEIVPTTWASLVPDIAAGKFDIGMGGISVSLIRQKTVFFSIPVMRVGKTPIVRCADKSRYQTLAQIDRPNVRVIVNPGGTNEKFDRANLKLAQIILSPDNTKIFDELIAKKADVMITDSVETKLQQKLHPELCAVHPDQPFDYGELAYLLPRDVVLQQYVNQWLHLATENGTWRTKLETYLGATQK
jgi:cyclohexadienyl dehydratase